MTDTRADQLVTVFGSATNPNLNVDQVSIYFGTIDRALSVNVPQVVIYFGVREFQIPLNYHGWLIRSIQAFPLFIESDGYDDLR